MTLFTLTGTTGAASILTGSIVPRDATVFGGLTSSAVLEGTLRQTIFRLVGSVDVLPALTGAALPAIPNLLTPVAAVEGTWQNRWVSGSLLVGAADMLGDQTSSFVRLGNSAADGTKSVNYGRVISAAELTGLLTAAPVISGTVIGTPVLAQAYSLTGTVDVAPVLTVTLALDGTRKSPPFVLHDGTNFLARASSDAVLSPASAFTISVTFDPELVIPGTTGVIVGKNNQTGTQAGWKISYNSTTGVVTFTAYGAADGSISISRPTSTAIRKRARLTVIVDGAGAITLYVDGSTNQGTQTDVGTWAGLNASTEPFAMGCDEPSLGGSNRTRNAIYDFAMWDTNLSGPEAALLLPDGFITIGVPLGNLQVYWDSATIQVASPTNQFAAWTDSIAGLELRAGNPTSYQPVVAMSALSGVTAQSPLLPFTHYYTSSMLDQADADPDPSLTTTHRLSTDARWRLWSAGSITPQLGAGFRQYRGDITVTVVLSRVSGATNIIVLKLWGLRVEFQATATFFVISGDDNVSSTNNRYDYGFALPTGRTEPGTEVVTNAQSVILTLRYNSFDNDLDVFVGTGRRRTRTKLTAQAANERSLGLLFADFGDFRLASVVPSCLSDAQVEQMVSGINPLTYGWLTESNRHGDHPEPYGIADKSPFPFRDDRLAEEVPLADSATTVSGTVEYAYAGGVDPGSMLLTMPRSDSGTMQYQDNGSGAFVAVSGAQPVSASSISYVGSVATGSVSLAAGQPAEGDTLTIERADGELVVTFEFDADTNVVGGNVPVTIGASATATATNLRAAITAQPLLRVTAGGTGTTVTLVHQDRRRPITNTITVTGGVLSATDFSGGINPGEWSLTITGSGLTFSTALHGSMRYFWLSQGLNTVPANLGLDLIETQLIQLYAAPQYPLLYTNSPFIIKDGFDEDEIGGGGSAFTDPLPTVISVTADSAHNITAIANAGPTNAGSVISWWEIELVSGSTEVMVFADYFQPNNFGVNRNHTDQFPIPAGQDWNEKRIRFVVQPVSDGSQIFRSLFVRMLGDEFDNAPPEVIVAPAPTPGSNFDVGDLLTTEERKRLVLARRARRPTPVDPQRETSRYKTTKVFEGPRGLELGLLEVLDDFYIVGSTFRTYVVRSLDIGFLDRIAVQFYGAGFEWAWWVLAYANSMVDPDQEMFVGQRLVIPPRDSVQRFLSRRPVTTLSS